MSGAGFDSYAKIPLISNAAAAGVTGFLTIVIASWDGHLPHCHADLANVKPFLLLMLPSAGMLLAYWIKSIGFKWSIGIANRQLLSINKKMEKRLRRDIKKYNDIISKEKIDGFRIQLGEVLQDRHSIISNIYQSKIKERDITQGKFEAHQQSVVNDNPELQSILEDQKTN